MKKKAKQAVKANRDDWSGELCYIGDAMISVSGKQMIFRIDGGGSRIGRIEKMFKAHGAQAINHIHINLTSTEVQAMKCRGVDATFFNNPFTLNRFGECFLGKMLVVYHASSGEMRTIIQGAGQIIDFFGNMFRAHGLDIEGVEIQPTEKELDQFKKSVEDMNR